MKELGLATAEPAGTDVLAGWAAARYHGGTGDRENKPMPYQFPPDLDVLVRERMESGNYPTEDEMLKEALLALTEQEEDLLAVRESLAEFAAGDPGVPLNEAFDHVRQGHAANPKL